MDKEDADVPTKKVTDARIPLTDKQAMVYEYIKHYIQSNAVSPSWTDIKDDLGFCSFNLVTKYIVQLQKKGWITRPKFSKRSIKLIDGSGRAAKVRHNYCPECGRMFR